MTRDECADLSALLSRLIAVAGGQSLPLPFVRRCPRCWGEVSPADIFGRDGFRCGRGIGYTGGCGWRGEPETFDLIDAARSSREAIDSLLARIDELEAADPVLCGYCPAVPGGACKRSHGPCLSKTC